MKSLLKVRFVRIFLWLTGGSLFLLLVLDRIVMPWYVNRGGTLEVPNVVGMKEADAAHLLDSLKLEPRKGETRPDKDYPEGFVIAQNPAPMQIVKAGRRVYLSISGGEQLVYVPTLKGRSVRDAKFALERNGLKLGTITNQISEEFPEGTIVSQDINPGAEVKGGILIGVTVSSGKTIDSVLIPNVIGRALSDVQKILADRKLKVGNITYQVNTEFLPNTVLDQYPRANEVTSSGKGVDLFVAQAPEKKRVQREN